MSANMKRREFVMLLGGAAAAYVSWPMTTLAQVPDRHIGVLMGLAEDDRDTKARLFGLRQGLEKLGWIEGRNVRIDYRFAPGGARAEVFAKELVELRPDVILSNTSPATAALQRETNVIPIVFTGVADPIGSGFVAGLARPGGNITGFMLFESSVTGKWRGIFHVDWNIISIMPQPHCGKPGESACSPAPAVGSSAGHPLETFPHQLEGRAFTTGVDRPCVISSQPRSDSPG
jgi:ABC transporter substrate binding protein